jgi:hypothetical protein
MQPKVTNGYLRKFMKGIEIDILNASPCLLLSEVSTKTIQNSPEYKVKRHAN